MKVKFLFFLFTFMLLPFCIFAGDTGKLAGKVTDSQTGEALIGVTVLLEGTSNGSVTDENGLYIVNNISPGRYTVVFTSIGYQKKTAVNVQISADFTSRQDITMDPETVNLASVIVYADAPLIRKDLTSSHSTIDAGQIENLPVESIDQILSLQAGITKDNSGELHIRGGRANEVDYTINGV
ncbi:MAG: TonB-dependent receptor, partial [Ignavibacteriales bacterium]|nr:TonB-dependent receptor [Ignavibacteriales bacterium]